MMWTRGVLIVVGVVGAVASAGCGAATPPASTPPPVVSAGSGASVDATFAEQLGGGAVTYDQKLVPAGATAKVTSSSSGGATTVALTVSGLVPNRMYGAHAHANACGAKGDDAGPHFQLKQDPVKPSVDPAYANATNEIWLDFTSDASGAATAKATVPWEFPADRRAKSVIVHAMPTMTAAGKAGTAGARAACIDVAF
jgi:superoxide dismutase, Cu-Zn family